jgi:hypothetical protein
MLSGNAKATANSTFYSVHGLLEKNYGCCCVPLSLHSDNLSQLFNDYTTKQMVHIHNYSCTRKWQVHLPVTLKPTWLLFILGH